MKVAAEGKPFELVIRRDGKRQRVEVTPKQTYDGPRIGVSLGAAYDFPFDVKVLIDPRIGGPSAGLMFSLAIYDTLTPGSLTGGHDIAGTGEITADGTVGPIGGHRPEDRRRPRRRGRAVPGARRQLRAGARRASRGHEAGPREDDARRPPVHPDLGRRPGRRPALVHQGVTVTDHQPVDPADEGVPEGPLPDPALASAVLEIEQHISSAGLGPAGPALRAGQHR